MTPLDRPLLVRSPADLVVAVPYLLGFHPANSLVVSGMAGHGVMFLARHDLPPPELDELARTVVAQGVQVAAVVGYGPPESVTLAVLQMAMALRDQGLRVVDLLRVTDDRWWSYLCDNPRCCPSEGTPCRPGDSATAAGAVLLGMVALPSRQELVARVAPVDGAARAAMRAATERAIRRMADLTGEDVRVRRSGGLVRRAARVAVREAERRAREASPLSDDEVAWLGLLLVDPVAQDYAIDRSAEERWRIGLWTDMLRRVEPAYAPGPACLLAYAAWQAGDGSLARVAVDRALAEAPEHRLAALLDNVLGAAIAPHMVAERAAGGARRRPA